MRKLQPVIKWSGSKRYQAENLVSLIPDKDYETYYEPFCGGASVLFYILSNCPGRFKRYVCSDINRSLIDLFNLIKHDYMKVYDAYFELWKGLTAKEDISSRRDYYMKLRDMYNESHDPIVFLFLTRTSYNGLVRYNSEGKFNSPFHLSRLGITPDKFGEILMDWSETLRFNRVEFLCQDYREVKPSKDDFVYMDPPYSAVGGLYFGRIDYTEFFDYLRVLESDFMFSFDGAGTSDLVVPEDVYFDVLQLDNKSSSFVRLAKQEVRGVRESLYISFGRK